MLIKWCLDGKSVKNSFKTLVLQSAIRADSVCLSIKAKTYIHERVYVMDVTQRGLFQFDI